MIRLFEELREFGYRGGYDAVRRYAAGSHRERSVATSAAYVPLSFAPGEAYQFDWSHEIVVIAGVTTTIKVAHVRLCHSRMFYVRAYPRESQEMVFDAHDRAFAFFGGACQRGIYDKMKTAVDAIFVGRDRQYNRRFQQMCGHYLVEPVACTPASGAPLNGGPAMPPLTQPSSPSRFLTADCIACAQVRSRRGNEMRGSESWPTMTRVISVPRPSDWGC